MLLRFIASQGGGALVQGVNVGGEVASLADALCNIHGPEATDPVPSSDSDEEPETEAPA